jgi:ATP-binding cassette subfamily B protein
MYGGIILGIAGIVALMRLFWRLLLFGFSRRVENDLRNRLFGHVLTLDQSFYQRRTAGEIMALATNDLTAVQLGLGMGLVALVDAVFMGLAAIAFMAYIDPGLAFLVVAPMPILAVLTRMLSARLHHRFRKVQEQFSTMTEFVRSTLSSIRLIKAYNQENFQAENFDEMGKTYIQNNVKLSTIYGTLFPISGLIGNVSMLLVLLVGGRMTLMGEITAGDFVAFISYLFLLTWPMMALGWVTDLFQRGVTSLGRIQAMLNEKPQLQDMPEAGATPIEKGSIEIRRLSFRYPGMEEPALKDIDLNIRPGMFIGVVGRTGAGKSTLCQLLARLYPVPEGTIRFDGMDVTRLPLAAVRGAIAYVPQDVTLFSETVAFNITMGKPRATQEEIETVARAAAIHDEIVAMRDGYQTRIGERGVKLSGGQRQRLALARALLLERPIIIIDDGLSAVDMETEHAIIRSITSFLKDRTCIIVSHRVAPLADAQEILVIEDGRIIERGTHNHLLESSPFYSTIYRQQTNSVITGI